MSYDMVIETKEALKAWAEEFIRLINAKKQSVTLVVKDVSPPVAESLRRWLRYADVAILDIQKATSKQQMQTSYNVCMSDYTKLVGSTLQKNAYTTQKDSGVALTGIKTGSPAKTAALPQGTTPLQVVYPAARVSTSWGGLFKVLLIAGVIFLVVR